jgi:hypothetical protein
MVIATIVRRTSRLVLNSAFLDQRLRAGVAAIGAGGTV